jgi:hypothetical protein
MRFPVPVLFAAALLAAGTAAADTAPAPVPGDTGISSLVYLDFAQSRSVQDDAAGKTPGSVDVDPTGPGFDISRFYIGVYHVFDDTWSVKLLPFYTSTAAAGTPSWYIKEAYLQGTFDDWARLRAGTAPQPWIPYVEKIYGYRFVEETLVERESIGNTADIGGHLAGGDDTFNYDLAVVNGGGYKNPGRTKAVDEEARVAYLPVPQLTFALGVYSGELGQDTEAVEVANAGKPENTATRLDFLAAWKADGLTLGGEYVHARNFSTSLIFSKTTDTQRGYSLFASYDLTERYSLFARYDDYRPNADTDPLKVEKYYDAGFAWRSSPNLTWALVYKDDRTADNLKLGKDVDSLDSQQLGIWAQIKY